MLTETTYALTEGARCLVGGGGVVILLPAKERLEGLTPNQVSMIKRLNAGAVSVDDADPEVAALLDKLIDAGVVSMTVSLEGRQLYSLKPFRRPPGPRPAASEQSVSLSRFTVVVRRDGAVVAENPRSWCDVLIHDADVLSIATGLGAATSGTVGARLMTDLRWTGHAVAPDREGGEFPTASWSPHELWFHRRSTVGDRGTNWVQFGPTRWADGRFEPLPARREAYGGEPISLSTPDVEALRAGDATLTATVEDRKSVRTFDDARPITVEQLGELLFRCARTRGVRTTNANRAVPEELPSKPFPSGGSLYELEVYVVARNVAGVEPGMYHYDSYDHALRPVASLQSAAVGRLLAPAALTLTDGQLPQVLLVLAARPGRIMWTYEQMPYAVILKHVGVLTQTLYLTATAMGLGGVAQGYGDTAAFAEATGNDELVECNVGSFVVGAPSAG